jgi:hypothetical protein
VDLELLKALGQIHGDLISLALFAEVNRVDLNTLIKDARRSGADVPGGYLNLPKYLAYCKAKGEAADAKKNMANHPSGSIETTINPHLLRGQKTRLSKLIFKDQERIIEIDRLLRNEKDKLRRSDLETERQNRAAKIDSKKDTLRRVEIRLDELSKQSPTGKGPGGESDTEAVSS